MRAGGGAEKGHKWERDVGKQLSLWLTKGQYPDLMSRNVLSGGSFTIAENARRSTARKPGDLIAANPLAFAFLTRFSIECKHLRDIGLEPWLFHPQGQSELGRIIDKAQSQARVIGAEYMVIAKQNHRDAMVFMRGAVGKIMLECPVKRSRATLRPMYHMFHGDAACGMLLVPMLRWVDPDQLLIRVGKS